MNKKFVFAIEIVWLICAFLGLLAGIHKTYYHGFNQSYLFFIITLICILMYLIRRGMRKINKN